MSNIIKKIGLISIYDNQSYVTVLRLLQEQQKWVQETLRRTQKRKKTQLQTTNNWSSSNRLTCLTFQPRKNLSGPEKNTTTIQANFIITKKKMRSIIKMHKAINARWWLTLEVIRTIGWVRWWQGFTTHQSKNINTLTELPSWSLTST